MFLCNEVVPAPQGQLAEPGADVLKVRFADDVIISFAGRLVPLKGTGSIRKRAVTSRAVTKRALGSLPPDRGELVARARRADMRRAEMTRRA